jgi:hypothetical protein
MLHDFGRRLTFRSELNNVIGGERNYRIATIAGLLELLNNSESFVCLSMENDGSRPISRRKISISAFVSRS